MISHDHLLDILAESFSDYQKFLESSRWRGKEHDCVNLFVHKFLLSKITPEGPIFDPTQIGIETSIPQGDGLGKKQAVRKDLVIWPNPEMTTWNAEWKAEFLPIAVIEWKARRKKSGLPLIFPYDLEWITKYSKQRKDFIGCCATVDFTESQTRLVTALVQEGNITLDFHNKLIKKY
jgi:hypothetical protein